MSCVGFFTPQQLARVREAAADPRPVSTFASPEVTPAKVARVRSMGESADVRIRESAALSYAAPPELLAELADDTERSVRCCVARNEHAPEGTLARLAGDDDPGVRGWVAANAATSASTLERLATDDDATVRAVVTWARNWR